MKAGKGLRGTARRASLLPARYGLTPDKLRTRKADFATMLSGLTGINEIFEGTD